MAHVRVLVFVCMKIENLWKRFGQDPVHRAVGALSGSLKYSNSFALAGDSGLGLPLQLYGFTQYMIQTQL